MSERDRYIPGVPCWVDTSQPDPHAALGFYAGLFGWEFQNIMPESESGYFVGRIRGKDVGAVAGVAEGAPPVATWNTYIWVESADQTASKVVTAGGSALTEPFDVQDHGRMAVLADPEGAGFCVWEARAHRGAAIVNEPGSVNFNGLQTRDLDRAKAFYGEVFGWTTLSVPGGMTAWTLPGYGDHLALDRPTIREEMAALGAPRIRGCRCDHRADRRRSAGHPAALGCDLRGRRRGRDLGEGDGPRRHRGRRTFRRTVRADDGDRRPAGGDVHRQQVRPPNRDGAGVADAAVNAA